MPSAVGVTDEMRMKRLAPTADRLVPAHAGDDWQSGGVQANESASEPFCSKLLNGGRP